MASSQTSIVLSPEEIERREEVHRLIEEGHEQVFYDLDRVQEIGEHAYELAAQQLGPANTRYERGMAGALSVLGTRLISIDLYKQSLEQAQLGLSMLEPDEKDLYYVRLTGLVAEAKFFMGDYAEGLEMETWVAKNFHDLGHKKMECRTLAALAAMHYQLEHSEAALSVLNQALDICREIDEPTMLVMQLNNLAWFQAQSGQTNEALKTIEESLSLCRLHNCRSFEPALLDTLSTIYMNTGNLEKAEEVEKESIAISKILGDLSGVATGNIRISEIYTAREQYDEAIRYAEQALEVKQSVEKRFEVVDIHRLLYELYEKNNQLDKALFHMKQLFDLEKEKAKHQADSRVMGIRVQHQIETAKKDAEIYRLRAVALEGEVEQQRLEQIRLETENSMDPLTGLFNRRHLPVLKERLHEGHSNKQYSSLLVLDIDHFKSVNDTYGHLAGDQVITAIAKCMKDSTRSADVCLRFGGEEFLVFLPNTNLKEAVVIAEKIRKSVEAVPIATGDVDIPVTISIGATDSGDAREEDLRTLIDRADQALYRAKESGRNRVETEISPDRD